MVALKPQFKRGPQFTWCLLWHAAIIVCGLLKTVKLMWDELQLLLCCCATVPQVSCMTSVFQAGLFQFPHVLLWPTELTTAAWETRKVPPHTVLTVGSLHLPDNLQYELTLYIAGYKLHEDRVFDVRKKPRNAPLELNNTRFETFCA